MREVMGAALKSLGYSVNSINPSELMQAKELVMKWRENIVKFDAEAFGKGFAAGEFWGVHGYAENVFLELDPSMREDVAFFIPVEGGPMYMDNMVILKGAKNKDLALQFINFIHDPEIYAQIADFLMMPSINTAARQYRTKTPNYNIEDLANSELKEDLGENLELYNKIWQEIALVNRILENQTMLFLENQQLKVSVLDPLSGRARLGSSIVRRLYMAISGPGE